MHKAAGREWPILDDDDVIDYMIMEAVAVRVAEEERAEAKKAEKANWKKDTSGLLKVANI